ncbi:hypothetical protein NM688_g8160 [Phlebia brevispora]|uniref:Uncharacterized protein n=1 Tax=Phlebia brevispora TaxID=194682 RepID=A0ACC1RWJ8_9APHY|nr:hypothetical protein NM688_g8160 [Phlebia brevispora]
MRGKERERWLETVAAIVGIVPERAGSLSNWLDPRTFTAVRFPADHHLAVERLYSRQQNEFTTKAAETLCRYELDPSSSTYFKFALLCRGQRLTPTSGFRTNFHSPTSLHVKTFHYALCTIIVAPYTVSDTIYDKWHSCMWNETVNAHLRSSPVKPSRSRAGSVVASLQPSPELSTTQTVFSDWIGSGCRFEVVEEQIELEGYQIYAVEKWVVERKRPVIVLTVFTGDPCHKIIATALRPISSLSQVESVLEWEKAIHHLRRDGARPKETEKGVVMVTSLANFRSDYTIVHIPGGSFLHVREQLYTNINVLRMGCSGRSALTLEEPSDTTKDRFISAYHIPDKAVVRSSELFNTTVLELVKFIQAALAVCGMFDMSREERNGLLCDVTCEGIQRWITEIGEPCMEVEPMERVADPTVVAALFSMFVPKDPFLDPLGFAKALATFVASKSPHAHAHSLSLTHYSIPPISSLSPYTSTAAPSTQIAYLSQTLIEAINAAYDKAKQSDSYKVHRVLINKLDDLATDLRTNPDPGNSAKSIFGWASNLGPTSDLTKFVKVISENSRDGAPSLRYLWTGRPGEVVKKRKEKDAILSEGEEREREKEQEKEDKERDRYDKDNPKSSEDEAEGGIPWSGKVQRKLESWALGRTKKISGDFGGRGKPIGPTDSPSRGQSTQTSLVPSVVVSKEIDEDDILTSGQVSPVSEAHIRSHILGGAERKTLLRDLSRKEGLLAGRAPGWDRILSLMSAEEGEGVH